MSLTRRQSVLALMGLGVAGCSPAGPAGPAAGGRTLSFTDELGQATTLAVPSKRTVVFNKYNTELIRAIAGMDPVVGVASEEGRPSNHAYWPTIRPDMVVAASQSEPNYEKIVALKPDLVIFPRNGDWRNAREQLKGFAIPVIVITNWDITQFRRNAVSIGRIYEKPERAAQLIAFYDHYHQLIAQRLKAVTRRKTVYIEEVKNYAALVPGSAWHDMVEIAGGLNVFRDIDASSTGSKMGLAQTREVDPEEILKRRPEVIIKLEPSQYETHPEAFSKPILQSIAARPGFSQLEAVKTGQVYHLSYYLGGAGAKVVGALHVAKWLYPEPFADVDPDEAMRTWLVEFQGVPRPPGDYWTSLAKIRADEARAEAA